jgi:hypothetical protein
VKVGILNPFPGEAVLSFLAGAEEVTVIGEAGQELIGMLYMLKGKYDNLNIRIHPFSREKETVSGIRKTLTRACRHNAAAEIFFKNGACCGTFSCMCPHPSGTEPLRRQLHFLPGPAMPEDGDYLAEVI